MLCLKMPIIVKIPNDSSVGEWAIVELQGDLKSRNGASMHQQFIGDLHYTNKGNAVLIIGHHILHGEVVTMDKPFAILEQKQASETAQLQDTVEYHIKAIVKRKLLFGDRPKPIIANVPKTA